MNKRCYTKACDWLPIIEEWKQSGLSKKAFCRHRAINDKHFYRWYNKLIDWESTDKNLRKQAPLLPGDFIPVEMIRSSKTIANTTACVLHLSSRLQLHIPLSAIDRNFLRTLLEAAEVQSC